MATPISTAINAYADTLKREGVGAQPRPEAPGASFADLMRSVAENAVAAGGKADQAALAAIDGNANVSEVVTAVANAELALQTVVAIRDEVISAYQEILRMPI